MNRVVVEASLGEGRVLRLVQGDITEERVDAIVNAANARLAHGGGVAGAIVRKGGPQIQKESDGWLRAHGPVAHDRPAVTGAGALPCRLVIHAVGPVWGEGEEDAKLTAAVAGSLRTADEHKLTSLALPAISTGIFGFPVQRAAEVILEAVSGHFRGTPRTSLRDVRIVVFDEPASRTFAEVIARRADRAEGGA